MKLRRNPETGRVAELVPTGTYETDVRMWFTYRFEPGAGLVVENLTDEDVADWPEVVLAPRAASPQFAFAVACAGCEPHGVITDIHERDRMLGQHSGHEAAPYAVRLQHPAGGRKRVFAAGAEVTFHGSTAGGAADLVTATVQGIPVVLPDADGVDVSGYVVDVDGKSMFVPAPALALGSAR